MDNLISTSKIETLLHKAAEAGKNSYSPYSKFKVGSSVLCRSGEIYMGTNIENRSFGATICAERSAISAAVSNGEIEIIAICVYSPDYNDYLPPCGICRQVISEFGKDIKVILSDKNFNYKLLSIDDLLTYDSLRDLKNNE